MQDLVVASQWNEAMNHRVESALREQMPQARVVPAHGWDGLQGTRVLLAMASHGSEAAAAQPAGWPFDLRFVQLMSSGIDPYPPWLTKGRNPQLTIATARGTSAAPMAEFALAVIFAHAKRLPQIWIDHAEAWQPTLLDSVAGSTLGLVGLGALGEAVARKALGVGMNVVALRRSATASPVPQVRVVATLEELMPLADHLVLLAPATPETRHMIHAGTLALAKPQLHLINLARGSLVDQDALLAALDRGQIAAVTLDVTEPEPLPAGHPLYTHPRVRLSPHTSVLSAAVFDAVAAKAAHNIFAWWQGEAVEDAL